MFRLTKMLMAFRRASDAVAAAEQAERLAQERAFPIGCWVCWTHGYDTRRGEVIAHAGDRVKVRSAQEAEYWIGAYRITGVDVSGRE
jgi:hypothetical protein